MALERLDPVDQHNKMMLDHYARYYFAGQLVASRRVLDIACGYGYGSHLLAQAGAQSVVGYDVSGEAIAYAREHYAHERITYAERDIYDLHPSNDGLFDVITSFETIEHITRPEVAIQTLKALLEDTGVLVLSVPNDLDLKVDNPFHLSKFTIASFFELLRTHFPYVLGLYQNYTVGSMIWSTSHAQEDRTPDSTARRIDIDSYILGDEHEDTQHADCFMALCSRQPIAAPRQIVLQAGWVWRSHNAELAQLIDTLWNDGQRLSRSWEAHTATIQEQLTYISKLEQERDQLQRDNSQLSQETQRLAESWDSHTAHIQALQQRLVEIEQHRDQIWQDGQRLSESWQEQARLIEDLRRQLGEATLQIEDLRSQLDEAELQIAQLNGILEHNRHLIEARSWVDGRVSGVRRRMRLVGRNTRRKQGR